MGFCFGVRDAIDVVRELGEAGNPVYTLGPIVHNPQVAEELKRSMSTSSTTSTRCRRLHGGYHRSRRRPDLEETGRASGAQGDRHHLSAGDQDNRNRADLVKTRHSVLATATNHKEVKGNRCLVRG